MDIRTIFEIDIIINDILTEKSSPGIYYQKFNELSNKQSRRRIIYSSPLWFRDDTHRLQRKPIRRSTSVDSAINEIASQELTMTDSSDNSVLNNSTPLRTPGLKRTAQQCRTLRRNQLMHWHDLNQDFFSSTMINNDCFTNVNNVSGTNQSTVFETEKNTPHRNHRSMIKIFNSWIEWTPFWSRDHDSKRLDRRHYISDFLDI